MKFWFNLSIRIKFIVITILISSISTIVGLAIVNLFQFNRVKLDKENDIILKSKLIGEYVVTSLLFPDSLGAVSVLKKIDAVSYIKNIALYDSTGKIFASYSKQKSAYNPILLEKMNIKGDSLIYDKGSLKVIISIYYNSMCYGFLYLESDLESVSSRQSEMLLVMLFSLLLVSLMSYILANNAQRILFKPLLKLTKLTSIVTNSQDYTIRSIPKYEDEIGVLMLSFNKMMDLIERTINELDDAQVNLRHSEERYRGLVNNSPIPIYILREDKCNFTNLAGIELLGGSIFNIINHDFIEFLDPSSRKEFQYYFEPGKLKENEPISREMKILKNAEEILFINITGIKIVEFGDYSTVLMCVNVTDRKIAEHEILKLNANLENEIEIRTKELKFALTELIEKNKQLTLAEQNMRTLMEEAERANKAKTEFIANMSHEIRTPLNSIIGFSDILLKKIKNPDYINFLNSIVTSGDALLAIINDILDISKIEAGQVELRLSKVNLNQILSDLQQLFLPKLIEKNVEFILEIHNLPKYILIDEARIRQILMNLISNAVKFTDNGFIKITVKTQILNHEAINLTIDIEDTGIGISNKFLDKLFDVFSQEHWDKNRKYGGTGLGLAISKRLIEKLNGTISVRSDIDSGSTFTIELADIEIIDDNDYNHQPIKSSRGNVRFEPASILVVDDIEFNRILIKEYINNTGLNYYEAQDSTEALELLDEMNFDLILMDLKLPEIGGLALTKIIKSNEKYKPCPILAFTASAIKFELTEYDGMFDGYLVKPLKHEDLIIELSKHLKIIYNHELGNYYEHLSEYNNDADLDPILLNTIINSLESDLLPGIDYLTQYLILGEIENLIVKLNSINANAKISHLTKYSNELYLSMKKFDVKNIKISLSNFNKLIETLKELYNSKTQNI